MKTQDVRLFDVFILGPFMLYLALQTRRATRIERTLLAAAGAGTILYNWRNYRLAQQNETVSGASV